jgi:hypothetical protein
MGEELKCFGIVFGQAHDEVAEPCFGARAVVIDRLVRCPDHSDPLRARLRQPLEHHRAERLGHGFHLLPDSSVGLGKDERQRNVSAQDRICRASGGKEVAVKRGELPTGVVERRRPAGGPPHRSSRRRPTELPGAG